MVKARSRAARRKQARAIKTVASNFIMGVGLVRSRLGNLVSQSEVGCPIHAVVAGVGVRFAAKFQSHHAKRDFPWGDFAAEDHRPDIGDPGERFFYVTVGVPARAVDEAFCFLKDGFIEAECWL